MRFAQHFVGAEVVSTTLDNAGPLIEAFVFKRGEQLELALINKTDTPFTCALPAGVLAVPRLLLSGPAIDAKEGVNLSPLHKGHSSKVAITAPYTAITFDLKGAATTRTETKR
jgi:hypothetical protein